MTDEPANEPITPHVVVTIVVLAVLVAVLVLAGVLIARNNNSALNAGAPGTTATTAVTRGSLGTRPGTIVPPGARPTIPGATTTTPACNNDAPLPKPGPATEQTDAAVSAALVGCPEVAVTARAKAAGWTTRVVHRDGEDFMVTMDYNAERLNLSIENGIVTAVTIG